MLASLGRLEGLAQVSPQIIVSDNNTHDLTHGAVCSITRCFPCSVCTVKAQRPGKAAALNVAVRSASGELLAFVDDDVVVDQDWLRQISRFCETTNYPAAQGRILHAPSAAEEPEIRTLMRRYRTIPYLNFGADIQEVHSLNGANFVIRREVLEKVGGFDERLGPGASGTSEDVELARRIQHAGYRIGYMRDATVYHDVNRARLTETYFKQIHRRQGASRWLINEPGSAQIWYDLGRASLGYMFYKSVGQERKSYRNKGRIYHYLGMLEAKRSQKAAR